ncbi:MAG: tRNA epoxyqueuosine(34) reductase QueG [Gemmatimonadota bacterium]
MTAAADAAARGRDEPPAGTRHEARDRAALLRSIALEAGFSLAGVCRPDPSAHAAFLDRWLAEGRQGEMDYMARPETVARRRDLALAFPEVRSVLVVAHPYGDGNAASPVDDPSRGVIARYAVGRDYHRVLKGRLRRLHRRFEAGVGETIPARVYVDTGPILERELGLRAGLGWFGRNTMLIHPRKGSYFFLGALLLGTELEPDSSFDRDHCGSCRACLDACPTGALLGRDETGAPLMDARACISYLTIEHHGPIPRELRPALGNRIYGCDICQEACPFNLRFGEEPGDPGYAAREPGEPPAGVEPVGVGGRSQGDAKRPLHPGTKAPGLVELMRMDEAAWDAFTRGSAIRRAGYAGFRRNIAVALGNWGAEDVVPPLTDALADPHPLVRGHAAWALGQVGSPSARVALGAHLAHEGDDWVRSELLAALG